MKVLFFEPNPDVENSISSLFVSKGFAYHKSYNRKDLEKLINEVNPDIIYDINDSLDHKRKLSIVDYDTRGYKLIDGADIVINSDEDELLKGLNLTISLKKELELYKNKLNDELEKLSEAKSSLEKENELHQMNIQELTETNNHLVAATWRERAIKQKLAQTLDELQKTKEVVEEQHRKISESIDYAKRIQKSVTPTREMLKNIFPDCFMLYKPRDVVSGDFPWIMDTKTHTYIAAVDCTGHGVPGAMLAVIGTLLLKDIVHQGSRTLEPSHVLDHLHDEVVKTLNQEAEMNVEDGMDIALIRIEKKTNMMDFAGAKRPLVLHSDGEIIETKGDRMPIGGVNYRKRTLYTNHTYQLKKDDIVIISSDGYVDQMNVDDRKIGSRGLKTIIEENSGDRFHNTKDALWKYYKKWKGENRQIDDVLVIGIKI